MKRNTHTDKYIVKKIVQRHLKAIIREVKEVTDTPHSLILITAEFGKKKPIVQSFTTLDPEEAIHLLGSALDNDPLLNLKTNNNHGPIQPTEPLPHP